MKRILTSFAILITFGPLLKAQMPDPKAMSGMPLPVADLAPGTITARVIGGSLTNPLKGQTVELVGGAAKKETTDDAGRATFSGVAPGTKVKLAVVVKGERIESQEFDVPQTGGIRVMLVATDPEAEKKAADDLKLAQGPAVQGSVVLGDQSRFVLEMGDDALNVFNMIQILNAAKQPVNTGAPLVFELPSDAVGAGMMEGSSPKAVVAGRKVTVTGPFPPGNTVVQFAYSIPLGSDSIRIDQKLPAALPQVSVVVQKIGQMQLSSPQIAERREMPAEGNTYIVGQGGPLKAGDTVSLTLTGVPSRPSWPKNLAVALSVLILAGGVWLSLKKEASPDRSPTRQALHTRRDSLFTELTALEQQRRKGSIDADTYAARRESLVTALEDLYRGLDREVA